MQEDAFSHVDELISAGYQARAQMTQKSLDKLLDLLTDSQELENREYSPSAQSGRLSEQTNDGLSLGSVLVDRSSAVPGRTNGNCTEWKKSMQIGRAARQGPQYLEGQGHHGGGPSRNSGGSNQANQPLEGVRKRVASDQAQVQAKGNGLSHRNVEQSRTSAKRSDGVPRNFSTQNKDADTGQQTGCENRGGGDYRGADFQNDRGYYPHVFGVRARGVGGSDFSGQNPYWREDSFRGAPSFNGSRPYYSAPGSFGGAMGAGTTLFGSPGAVWEWRF